MKKKSPIFPCPHIGKCWKQQRTLERTFQSNYKFKCEVSKGLLFIMKRIIRNYDNIYSYFCKIIAYNRAQIAYIRSVFNSKKLGPGNLLLIAGNCLYPDCLYPGYSVYKRKYPFLCLFVRLFPIAGQTIGPRAAKFGMGHPEHPGSNIGGVRTWGRCSLSSSWPPWPC